MLLRFISNVHRSCPGVLAAVQLVLFAIAFGWPVGATGQPCPQYSGPPTVPIAYPPSGYYPSVSAPDYPPGSFTPQPGQSPAFSPIHQPIYSRTDSPGGALAPADGRVAFNRYCTNCHEASRALEVKQSVDEWRKTIVKMAALAKKKEKVEEIPDEVHAPIAAYLASVAGPGAVDPKGKGPKPKSPEEQAKVAAGQAAFQTKCTTCHDAGRSLDKTKSPAEWQTTVQRMAAKPGANISAEEVGTIAAYLADRGEGREGKGRDLSSFSVFGTIAPLYRGGGGSNVQNNGFFPEAWLGAAWQGKGALSARVTVCTSCHGVNEAAGFLQRIDLLETVVRFDITQFLGADRTHGVQASVEAGRFIAPFGAFSAQVNPGVYRTVSKPLIFNMGQRAHDGDIGDVVLPLPYADEGVLLSMAAPICDFGKEKVTATIDVYAVNGLVGGQDGIDFDRSRDLLDNNDRPAWGGRMTVGTSFLRLGSSITGGQFNDTPFAGSFAGPMRYLIYGFDLTARYKDLFRFQAEYARRNNDRFDTNNNVLVREHVQGVYAEAECRLVEKSPLSFLGRYDWLGRGSPLPVSGSAIPTGTFSVNRLTVGVNYAFSGRSLLMLNYERWFIPDRIGNVDVWGAKFAYTF
jgi:mono/diheme cytochrome c family protein